MSDKIRWRDAERDELRAEVERLREALGWFLTVPTTISTTMSAEKPSTGTMG